MIVVFIASTISGLSYTLFRYNVPGVPRFFRQWSYGMMAPYQTYRTYNEELIAEGKMGDTWQLINLDEYFPYVRGERAMRSYLVTFRKKHDLWPRKYREYALLIKGMEHRRGRMWEDVRLSLERWPMSPGGYEYLRHEPFTSYIKIYD